MIYEKEEDIKNCKLGLYRIYWKGGGSSVGAIGQLYDGERWIAPCNWTTGEEHNYNPTGRMSDNFDSIKMLVLICSN